MKKLKFKLAFAALAAAALLSAGCAGAELSGKKILSFTITPDAHLMPGSVVTVKITTTPDITAVTGWLEIPGLPKFSLKYSDKE